MSAGASWPVITSTIWGSVRNSSAMVRVMAGGMVGRKEHGSAARWGLFQNGLNVPYKAHVEHFVGFCPARPF